MKKIISVLLSVCMVLSFCAVAFAEDAKEPHNGPCTDDGYGFMTFLLMYEVDEEGHSFGDEYYLYSGSGEPETLDGAVYTLADNTLTLTNFTGNYVVVTNMMGDDFTIKVDGECSLARILLWGDGWGSSLKITGNGSLTVNGASVFNYGIEVHPELTDFVLDIDPKVEVTLKGKRAPLGVLADPWFDPAEIAKCTVTVISGGSAVATEQKTAVRTESMSLWCIDSSYERNTGRAVCADDPDGFYAINKSWDAQNKVYYSVERLRYLESMDAYTVDIDWENEIGPDGLKFDTLADAAAAGYTTTVDGSGEPALVSITYYSAISREDVLVDESGNRYLYVWDWEEGVGSVYRYWTFEPVSGDEDLCVKKEIVSDVDASSLTPIMQDVTYDEFSDIVLPGTEWTSKKAEHVHDYKPVEVHAPTCLERGFTVFKCECGDSYEGNYQDALGHDFGAWTVAKAATCTAKGKETRTCDRCYIVEERDVDMKAHTPGDKVKENEKDGSYDLVTYCAVCKAELSRETVKADPPVATVLLGDVDDSKDIDVKDARLCLRRAINLETYPEGSREFIACDVDKDVGVSVSDARWILRAAIKLDAPESFPAYTR